MHERRPGAAWCSAGARGFLVPALLLALSLAWGTAAAAPAAPEPRGRKTVRSLREMRQERVVRQTWDLSCGAAALSTLLTYHLDDPVSEPEVVATVLQRTDPVKIRARQGFSLLDLKRFVISRGHEAEGYGQLDLEHLVKLAPAIVPTTLGGYNHFVVFRGVRGGHVLLADPAFGNRTLPVDQFEALWSRRIAFVVKPGDGTRASSPLRLSGRSELPVVPPTAVREAIGVLR
jgi:uncharacterized protein